MLHFDGHDVILAKLEVLSRLNVEKNGFGEALAIGIK